MPAKAGIQVFCHAKNLFKTTSQRRFIMQTPTEESFRLWMEKPAPRYTSYPTAPFFHDGVGEADYAAALAEVKPGDPVSLYFHIPFCAEMCLFCGCHTYITKREDRISAYIDALIREMELAAAHAPQKLRMSHLHFGGGTPNAMPAATMRHLFEAMHRMFDFSLCREFAMEIDPRTLDRDQVKAMADAGVTRVSLGVQDFNLEVQKLVNRVQPYDLVAQVCDWLREAGLMRINFDLMYGLPAQTPGSVLATARQAAGLGPDRFALFSYAHVPHMKPHQKALNDRGIAGDRERLAMERNVRDVLTDAGYESIGMDHFAKPEDSLARAQREGRMRRNFQGYTDDEAETMIALGASAIGFNKGGFVQNQKETRAYQAALAEGRLPIIRGYILTPEDRLRAAIIEQLMCYFTCDIAAICQQYQVQAGLFAPEMERLRAFEEAALVARDGARITLTSPYRQAIRSVASVFDAHAPRGNVTYSRVA
jgi:oxygen-independent coproporphyrinogen III oxidase